MASTDESLERLRAEVAGLAVDEILAVCYSMQQKQQPERQRFYLDILRRRGGQRAQFASCLICFDLARQGDPLAQQEFAYLADTIRLLAQDKQMVDGLLAGDPYLVYIWDLCLAQLAEMDPRFSESASPAEPVGQAVEAADVGSLELLSDADFAAEELDMRVADEDLWLRYDQAVEDFLGGRVGVPVYDATAGFRLHNGQDVERVERFLRELDSLREFVPLARGFRALALLFYGTHLRSKSIFGAVNQRKQAVLRAGLREFLESGNKMWDIAGVLGPAHADPDVWMKISDVVADYLAWLREAPGRGILGVEAYQAIERLVAREHGRTTKRP